MTSQEIDNLLEDYVNSSTSLKAIEAKYGVHSSRVYAELQKAGVPVRSPANSFKHSLNPTTVGNLVSAYNSGQAIEKIARDFQLNYDQVYVVIRENGLPARISDRRKAGDPKFKAVLAALYADTTLTVNEVAFRAGISVKTLSRMVIKFDLPRRGKGGGQGVLPKTVLDNLANYASRYEAGESIRSMAAEAGIGESTLRQKLAAFRQPRAE